MPYRRKELARITEKTVIFLGVETMSEAILSRYGIYCLFIEANEDFLRSLFHNFVASSDQIC